MSASSGTEAFKEIQKEKLIRASELTKSNISRKRYRKSRVFLLEMSLISRRAQLLGLVMGMRHEQSDFVVDTLFVSHGAQEVSALSAEYPQKFNINI